MRRRRTKRPRENSRIIGTRESGNANLRAGDQTAWLYVGRLHRSVEQGNLIAYLEDNGIRGNIECEELNVIGTNKAFKVGIPFDQKDLAELPDFWPKGVIVRQYIFRRHQRQGVRLQ